jgi:hypothetical protein
MATNSEAPPNVVTLLVSSEDVNWYQTSSKATVNYPSSIVPQDGYMLAYALRSIGFNGSATNISERQKNNRLSIDIRYDLSQVTHYLERVQPLTSPATIQARVPPAGSVPAGSTDGQYLWSIDTNWPIKPDHLEKKSVDEIIVRYDVIVPDGLYSLTTLFQFLSGFATTDFRIPLAEWIDLTTSTRLDDVNNIHYAKFLWTKTSSGFRIAFVPSDSPKTLGYTLAVSNLVISREQAFPRMIGVAIHPHSHEKLYSMLFTNYNSDDARMPISAMTSEPKTGKNPPFGIEFQYNENTLETMVKELGNEHHYDIPNGNYPTRHKVNTGIYQAFNIPLLDPLYVEVAINLPNHTMDGRAEKNTLTRIFVLGNFDESSTSYFRQWEQPKVTSLDSISGFNSVTITFSSEGEKWDFFNLEFCVELEIYQLLIPEQEDHEVEAKLIEDMPEDDPIAANLRTTPSSNTSRFGNTNTRANTTEAWLRQNHYSSARRTGGLVKRPRLGI